MVAKGPAIKTVKDLIEVLKKFNPQTRVLIRHENDWTAADSYVSVSEEVAVKRINHEWCLLFPPEAHGEVKTTCVIG